MTSSHVRAELRSRSQVTIPSEVKQALGIQEGDQLEFVIDDESGQVTVTGLTLVPTRPA